MKSHPAYASLGLLTLVAAVACRDASPPGPNVAAALTPPVIQHFVSNGPFASVSWGTSDAAGVVTFGSIAINRGGSVNNPETLLSYDVFECTPPNYLCNEIEAGYGTIPNTDFTASGKRSQLSTNTSDNSSVTRFVGDGGSIVIAWETNGIFSYEQQGITVQSSPGDSLVPGATRTTYRQQGSFSSLSANARGSVFGRDLPFGPNGGMGTSRNVSIQISR